jgi:Flp pilus assembly protein CpaB
VAAIHLSSGHIVMIVAGALGVLLTLGLLRAADRTVPVVVAVRELRAGAVVGTGDLGTARVRAGSATMATLFGASDLRSLRGRVIVGPVADGAPLLRSSLRPPGRPDARRTMSFPLPRSRALGGRLVPGDRVDVVAVDREARRAAYAVTGAEVVAMDGGDAGTLGGGSDEITVTLTVTPPVATRIAAALDAGSVTLVRATGAEATDPEPETGVVGESSP